MIQIRLSRLAIELLCGVVALLLCSTQQQAAFAQAKPETPMQNQPSGAQQPATQQPAAPQPAGQQPTAGQVQPAAQQPATVQPVSEKPQMGPPDPSRLAAEPGKIGGHGQAATIPAPTVQLKPGEVPAIKFDVADYNFGRIPAGQQVVHEFWFTNTGNGPLELLSVKPS